MTADRPVLVVGAGPTGLVLALWLKHLGVSFRIIDQSEQSATHSRALVVQARSLEHYQQLGIASEILARSRRIEGVNLWSRGAKKAHVPIPELGTGISPFPAPIVFPQDEHERFLIDKLDALGVQVERPLSLVSLTQDADHVSVWLRHADGRTEEAEFSYLAGCDGARSSTRESLRVGFAGGTYEHLFYVADIEAQGPAANGELHVDFESTDFLAVFPMKGQGRIRLVGTVHDDVAPRRSQEAVSERSKGSNAGNAGGKENSIGFDQVNQRGLKNLHLEVSQLHWFSTYRVHHRVADRFRVGRVFLLGDAAHVHSPAGGQGMNTGICDAVNLSWKLATALRSAAVADRILQSFEDERIGFARKLVATTDRAFAGMVSTSVLARFIRTVLAPRVMPLALRFAAVRRKLFMTISQTEVAYRSSSLSGGRAGALCGGDRLPWLAPTASHSGNYPMLAALCWQVHTFSPLDPATASRFERFSLPVYIFPFDSAAHAARFEENALYLIRPDGYISHISHRGQIGTDNGASIEDVLLRHVGDRNALVRRSI